MYILEAFVPNAAKNAPLHLLVYLTNAGVVQNINRESGVYGGSE